MVRTMLCENNLPKYFWGEAIITAFYVINRVTIRSLLSMDAKSDEAIFMGYALNSKAYRVFNKTSLIVEESIHVIFYETNVAPKKGVIANDDADIEDQAIKESKEKKQEDSK